MTPSRLAALFFSNLVVATILAGAAVTAAAQNAEPEHAHHHESAGELAMDGDQPWQTDEPLRRGMSEIRVAIGMLTPAYEARQLSVAQSRQLTEAVRLSVTNMISQCQLAPDADANLHVILGRILEAADVLDTAPLSADGLPAIQGALQDYGHYFSHAGWDAGVPADEHAHDH